MPASIRQSSGSAETYFESNARRLSHAEKARTMLSRASSGTLATLHHETGWPYGSIVNIASESIPGASPRVVAFVSRLAEHTANLLADRRASLLVSEQEGTGDRLATARATFLVEAEQVEKSSGAIQAFESAHPRAVYIHFEDFLCFELKVKSVRYIGGFGSMSWVDGTSFAEAEADPIWAESEAANTALRHYNESQAHDVVIMAKALGLPDAQKASMLSIDRYGFDVLCEMPDGLRRSRVEFARRLDNSKALAEVVDETLQKARRILSGAGD